MISPASFYNRWCLWWRQEVRFYTAADALQAELRGHHLALLRRFVPAYLASSLLGGGGVVLGLWGDVAPHKLLLWYGALVLLLTELTLSWRRQPKGRAAPAVVGGLLLRTLAGGLLWAAVMALWYAQLSSASQQLLVAVMCAALFAGACWHSPMPVVAGAWMLALIAGSVVPLWASGQPQLRLLSVLTVVYMGVAMAVVQLVALTLRARLAAEREAERQSQMVALLLRDFEEHATDALWEIDRKGCFSHVSQRLPQMLGLEAQRILGQPLMALLAARAAYGRLSPGLVTLHRALALDKPFRDVKLEVRLTPNSTQSRWWLLSAKPLLDERGTTSGWRGVITDVTQQQVAHQRLAVLAHSDSLTGLANRVQLRERVQAALDACRDSGRRSALICIDLDNFKQINDSLGHNWGDEVLKIVAQRLAAVMRRSDLVARLGGDEFAVVLDDIRSDEEAVHFAQRVLQVLNQPADVRDRSLSVGASIGVALLPEHGQTIDESLGNADLALYAAKQRGRARCEVFAPWLGERNRRTLAISQALAEALANQQFTLAWQPRVHIEDWRVVGAEALLRWRHPELGQVSPVEFIAVAESTGQIREIGSWVLEQACMEAQHSLHGLAISVNVSPVQLMSEHLLADVERALLRSGLPAHRLEVEITESIFVDDASVALANLHGIKRLGVQIAMDDFGTGYSSLAYLRRFPFDTLKIDRAFVRELMTHRDARSIVRTIVDLANNLGMQTVAEGVEEPAQLEVLRRAGCQAVQGYLVAQPLPLTMLQDLLATWEAQTRPDPGDEVVVTQSMALR